MHTCSLISMQCINGGNHFQFTFFLCVTLLSQYYFFVIMKSKSLRKWKAIPIHGEIIESTFIPFKTPYDNVNIAEEHQFTAQQFLEIIHANEFNVGLIIDLTNTNYYDKHVMIRNQIEYMKFPLRGFDTTPDKSDVTQFVQKCQQFRANNPNKLIVVHCTHGCNRTGFLIVAYLVMIFGFDAFEAIKLFNNARPPGIHKLFVIEDILSQYDNGRSSNAKQSFVQQEMLRINELKIA